MTTIENLKPLTNKEILTLKDTHVLMLQNHGSWFGYNLKYCIGDTMFLYADGEEDIDHMYSCELKMNNKTFVMFDVSKFCYNERCELIHNWSSKYKLENYKNGKMFNEFE